MKTQETARHTGYGSRITRYNGRKYRIPFADFVFEGERMRLSKKTLQKRLVCLQRQGLPCDQSVKAMREWPQ